MNPLQGPPLLERLRHPDVADLMRGQEVLVAWLFGSRSRGEARPESDLDLAVFLPEERSPLERLDRVGQLGRDLQALLHVPTEVVALNDASPVLRYEATVLGRPVYTLEEDDDFRYEQKVRQEYEDFQRAQRFFTRARRERLGMPTR